MSPARPGEPRDEGDGPLPRGARGPRRPGAGRRRPGPRRPGRRGGRPTRPLRGRAGGGRAVGRPAGPLRRPGGGGAEDRPGPARGRPPGRRRERPVVDVGPGVVDRNAARRPPPCPHPRLRRRGGDHAGAGRGGQHRHLLGAGCGAAPAPPLRTPGAPGARLRVRRSTSPTTPTTCAGAPSYEYRHVGDVFDGFGALYVYQETGADLTDGERTVRVTTVPVTAGYFETLGVAPQRGRTFREDESIAPGEQAKRQYGQPGWPAPSCSATTSGPTTSAATRACWAAPSAWTTAPSSGGRHARGLPGPLRPPRGPVDAPGPAPRRPRSHSLGQLLPVRRGPPEARPHPGGGAGPRDALYARLVEQHPEAKSAWVPTLVPLHADLVGPDAPHHAPPPGGRRGPRAAHRVREPGQPPLRAGTRPRPRRGRAHRPGLGPGPHRGRAAGGGRAPGAGRTAPPGSPSGGSGVHALLSLAPEALPRVADPAPDARGLRVRSPGRDARRPRALGPHPRATPLARLSGRRAARRTPGPPPAGGARAASGTGWPSSQVAAALILVTGAGLLGRSLAALATCP